MIARSITVDGSVALLVLCVYCEGLSDGLTNHEQLFVVDVSHAGQGRLSMSVDGPVQTDLVISDNANSVCNVKYLPTMRGSYLVNILLDNQHITGMIVVVEA